MYVSSSLTTAAGITTVGEIMAAYPFNEQLQCAGVRIMATVAVEEKGRVRLLDETSTGTTSRSKPLHDYFGHVSVALQKSAAADGAYIRMSSGGGGGSGGGSS